MQPWFSWNLFCRSSWLRTHRDLPTSETWPSITGWMETKTPPFFSSKIYHRLRTHQKNVKVLKCVPGTFPTENQDYREQRSSKAEGQHWTHCIAVPETHTLRTVEWKVKLDKIVCKQDIWQGHFSRTQCSFPGLLWLPRPCCAGASEDKSYVFADRSTYLNQMNDQG